MMDFVSRHRVSVVGVAAATSLLCAMLVPYGLPWAGRAWLSLALPVAIFFAMRKALWLWPEECEAPFAVAVPERRTRRMGAAQLRLKEEGTP